MNKQYGNTGEEMPAAFALQRMGLKPLDITPRVLSRAISLPELDFNRYALPSQSSPRSPGCGASWDISCANAAELAGFESSYRGGIERQNRTKDRTRVLPCGFSREKHTNRRRSIPQQGNSELNQASDWNREHCL